MQIGEPRRVYDHPKSRFVADFLGASNLFEGIALRGEHGIRVQTAVGPVFTDPDISIVPEGNRVVVAVRPERIALGEGAPEPPNAYRGIVEEVVYSGLNTLYIIRLQGDLRIRVLTLSDPTRRSFAVGSGVWASWPVTACRIVSSAT
jgi:ABC-type Fe3+/spermidine/putrescine transport system ATPase subunit